MVTVQGKVLSVGTLQNKSSMSGAQYQICTFNVTQGQTQYGVDMNNQPLVREEAWKFECLNENAQIVSQLQPGTPVSVDIMGDSRSQYGNRIRVLGVHVDNAVGTTPAYGQQQYAAPVTPASAGGYQTAPTPAFQQPGMYNQQQAPY